MAELEKRDKLVDNALDQLRALGQKWHDRLTLDNLRLCERYLDGTIELLILLRRQAALPFESHDFCAVLKHWEHSGRRRGVEEGGKPLADAIQQSPTLLGSEPGMGVAAIAELPQPAMPDDEQEAVLVDVVKLAECPERSIPTLVRLDRLNESFRTRADSLYFSRGMGHVFGRSIIKREGGLLSGGGSVRLDQLPRQVVEAAPQVVDGITGNQGQVDWRLCPHLSPKNSLIGLRVIVAQDAIWAGFSKGADPAFEIADVVFGPFDLR
jgi:hypothetical protein